MQDEELFYTVNSELLAALNCLRDKKYLTANVHAVRMYEASDAIERKDEAIKNLQTTAWKLIGYILCCNSEDSLSRVTAAFELAECLDNYTRHSGVVYFTEVIDCLSPLEKRNDQQNRLLANSRRAVVHSSYKSRDFLWLPALESARNDYAAIIYKTDSDLLAYAHCSVELTEGYYDSYNRKDGRACLESALQLLGQLTNKDLKEYYKVLRSYYSILCEHTDVSLLEHNLYMAAHNLFGGPDRACFKTLENAFHAISVANLMCLSDELLNEAIYLLRTLLERYQDKHFPEMENNKHLRNQPDCLRSMKEYLGVFETRKLSLSGMLSRSNMFAVGLVQEVKMARAELAEVKAQIAGYKNEANSLQLQKHDERVSRMAR